MTEDAARRSMTQLDETTVKNALSAKELKLEHCGKGGIRSNESVSN